MNYGFVGLGHQGTPMAERMIAAGLQPSLWARRREVLDRYTSTDAQLATSPAQLGSRCDVIGLCLYDADATESVLFGPDGLATNLRPKTVLALHSTVGPGYARSLAARLAERGVILVDAPVTGGDAAATGQLLVMTGGDEDALSRCGPMFASYANRVVHTGVVGSAQMAKLVNNTLMTAITGLVFDAFEFGAAMGIDREGLGEILASGSAANPSVGIFLRLGADTFSERAWPTLHKDVALASSLGIPTRVLLDVASATIVEMERRTDR